MLLCAAVLRFADFDLVNRLGLAVGENGPASSVWESPRRCRKKLELGVPWAQMHAASRDQFCVLPKSMHIYVWCVDAGVPSAEPKSGDFRVGATGSDGGGHPNIPEFLGSFCTAGSPEPAGEGFVGRA